jgi:outer membrane cobalamin receptor
MKLSVEMKVAAAVATSFVALTVGAIAQGYSKGQTGGLNDYGSTNNSSVNSYMSHQGHSSSLRDRTNSEENRQKFSNKDETARASKNVTKSKSLNSRKRHTTGVRQEPASLPVVSL